MYIITYECYSHGPPYSETFYFKNRYCLTACGRNESHILIHSEFNYRQKVNIFLKGTENTQ